MASGDLPGVINIADDILVYGAGETHEEAIADYDCKLESLLKRCCEIRIKLYPSKL